MSNPLVSAASDLFHTMTDRRFRQFNRQRRIFGLAAREREASRVAAGLHHDPSAAEAFAAETDALKRDGYVFIEPLITKPQIDEVLAYLSQHTCTDPYRPRQGPFKAPDEVPADTHVSHYANDVIIGAPHLLAIANDPKVLAIVEAVLGARPTIGALRLWWSTPTASGEPEHAENFHRDVDDLRFLKLFVYLTDVDEDAGPHIFAAGSHNRDVLTEIRRFTDDEVEEAVGRDNIQRLCGPAGTTFIENTYGLHRGLPPRIRPRLVFQPLYSLRPVIYGPKRPLRHKSAGDPPDLDPYVNRVFLQF